MQKQYMKREAGGETAALIRQLSAKLDERNSTLAKAMQDIEKLQTEGASNAELLAVAQNAHKSIVAELQAMKHGQLDTGKTPDLFADVRERTKACMQNPLAFRAKIKAASYLMVKFLTSTNQGATAGAFAGNSNTGVIAPANGLVTSVRALCFNIPAEANAMNGGYGTGVAFTRETVTTNGAGIVTPGADKPETVITYTPATENFATVAHIHPIAEQVFKQAPNCVEAAIFRMVVLLAEKVDDYILDQANAGATAVTIALSATVTAIDAVMLLVQASPESDMRPDVVFASRDFFNKIRNSKDANGLYILPVQLLDDEINVGGVPVRRADTLPANSLVTGPFGRGMMVHGTDGVEVATSNSDGDNFKKNLVTLRVEEMLAAYPLRPAAFFKSTVTGP